MNSLSRNPREASVTTSSAPPLPYISAVSIRVKPISMPSLTAAASSAVRRRSSPICQVPCPNAGTFSPFCNITCGRSSVIGSSLLLVIGWEMAGEIHRVVQYPKHAYYTPTGILYAKHDKMPSPPSKGREVKRVKLGLDVGSWMRAADPWAGLKSDYRIGDRVGVSICMCGAEAPLGPAIDLLDIFIGGAGDINAPDLSRFRHRGAGRSRSTGRCVHGSHRPFREWCIGPPPYRRCRLAPRREGCAAALRLRPHAARPGAARRAAPRSHSDTDRI